MNKEIQPTDCPCGSGKDLDSCCGPLLNGTKHAETAEQLMRSRYSAYVLGKIDYLLKTTHISERKNYSRKEIKKWSAESDWLKLEILNVTENTVEFKAFFRDKKSVLQIHHEHSNFLNENGKWYFL